MSASSSFAAEQIPWFYAEAYFYHYILHLCEYFDTTSTHLGVDPFRAQKLDELGRMSTWTTLVQSALKIANRGAGTADSPKTDASVGDALCELLEYDVWSNRVDLCYTSVAGSLHAMSAATGAGGGADAFAKTIQSERQHLIVNDQEQVRNHLLGIKKQRKSGKGATVAVITDNAGTELLLDLVVCDYLLRVGWADTITLHLKRRPTFVSDATITDVELHLRLIARWADAMQSTLLDSWCSRLRTALQSKTLILTDHVYWNGPLFFSHPASPTHSLFAGADLIIVKGDANYRRIVLDHVWSPPTQPIQPLMQSAFGAVTAPDQKTTATSKAPAPTRGVLCLRTLKSNAIAGLASESIVQGLDKTDSEWRVNGKRGIIQFGLVI